MRKKILILLVISSLILTACKDKEKPESAQENDDPVSNEVQQKDNAPIEVKEEEGDNEMKNEYNETTQAKVKELKELKEVDAKNYKIVQKIYEKYEKASENGLKIEKDEKEHLEKLKNDAEKIEGNIEAEGKQSTAFVFLETMNGLNAITGEGIIKKDLVFDRVEIKINEKIYEAKVEGHTFNLSRKLVTSDTVKEAVIIIYEKDKVVEELTVNIEGM